MARRASAPARRRSSTRTCSFSSATRRWATGSFIAALDRDDRQGGLARRRARTRRSWATPIVVKRRRPRRARRVGRRSRHRLRPADRQGVVAAPRHREPSDSRAPSPGTGSCSPPPGSQAEGRAGDAPGRHGDLNDSRGRVEVQQGHGLRAVADLLRRLPVPDDRRRHHDVPRREDGRAAVRGRPRAGAGDVHGVAGRVRRARSCSPARTATRSSSRRGRSTKCSRTNSVGEPVYASPALANGMIFIRGDKHLFAIK